MKEKEGCLNWPITFRGLSYDLFFVTSSAGQPSTKDIQYLGGYRSGHQQFVRSKPNSFYIWKPIKGKWATFIEDNSKSGTFGKI